MTRTIKRAWSPQIAKGFVSAYLVLLAIGGGLLLLSQLSLGERITRVEHTKTVELCSTKVSCHHLLDQLLAEVKPSDIAKLRKRIGPKPRRSVAPLARELAKRHAAPRSTPRPNRATSPPALVPLLPSHPTPAPSPAKPTATAPRPSTPAPAPSASPIPAPVPRLPTPEPPPPVVEVSPSKEGPLGLPCVKVVAIEALCHTAR